MDRVNSGAYSSPASPLHSSTLCFSPSLIYVPSSSPPSALYFFPLNPVAPNIFLFTPYTSSLNSSLLLSSLPPLHDFFLSLPSSIPPPVCSAQLCFVWPQCFDRPLSTVSEKGIKLQACRAMALCYSGDCMCVCVCVCVCVL